MASNSGGRWYYISNEDAEMLRGKLAGIVTLIPNGPWYPNGEDDRNLLRRLIRALTP